MNKKMKKIFFPITNRVHWTRQELLFNELEKYFEVELHDIAIASKEMCKNAMEYTTGFEKAISWSKPDISLIRGDRYEMLPAAMISAYKQIPIAHIEGGDLSGVIDNKVRHAITQLADIHFATNQESHERLLKMGTDPAKTFNFGSLDVEYAKSVKIRDILDRPYIVVCFHPIPGEDGEVIKKAVNEFKKDYQIVNISSNKDYGMVYPGEDYSPEDYICLLANAKCLVGNSSSFIKESSILGTPSLIVGTRQNQRLMPHNVLSVPYKVSSVVDGIKQQLQANFEPSDIYYQEGTSERITKTLYDYIGNNHNKKRE